MDFNLKLKSTQKKSLQKKYSEACLKGDLRSVRRINALLSLSEGYLVQVVAKILQVSQETVRQWVREFLNAGVASIKTKHPGGRPQKLTKTQKNELTNLIKSGPQACGFPGACWRTPMIQALIKDKFGVYFNAHYLSDYLKNLGFSYQRASFIATQKDLEARNIWLSKTWPEILEKQIKKDAYILFGDECSFAQWGSLSKTWAPIGNTPLVQTRGTRKNYKAFGAIDFHTGTFFHQGLDGKLNGESYVAFLQHILKSTRKQIILVQDGAPYHKSKIVKEFIEEQKSRLTVYTLPSYSPDFNPIEKLWKKIKEAYTHLQYFDTYESLVDQVQKALKGVTTKMVKPLFGMYQKLIDDRTIAA